MSTPERYDVREERRSRKQLSCAECHRLKLKCDREVPCSNCVRRECTDLCPNSVRVKKPTQRNDDLGEMRDRLAAIEGMLAAIPGLRRSRSGSTGRSRERERDRERDRRRRDEGGREREGRDRHGNDRREERRERRDEPRYWTEGDLQSRSPSPRYRSPHGTLPYTATARDERRSPRRPSREEAPQRAGPPLPTPPILVHSHSTSSLPNPGPSNLPGRGPSHPSHHATNSASSLLPPSYPTPQASQPTSSFEYTYERSPPPQDESYGTLVIDRSGRSKWLGPTAGTEWLRNQEVGPRRSRSRSPPPAERETDADWFGADSLFPFPPWGPAPTMATILLHLPPIAQARVLLDAYYGNYTWNHDVAPRAGVQPIFERAYGLQEDPSRVHPQQLALLFIILAMGALHNPALPPHDPGAEHHLAAARWCLVKGDFIGHNTIAGLQALVIMAHYALETEKGRNGDSAWPLWGLAMRLVTAMGLHIDGRRWNLPPEVAEERRHVFWECHTIDVFQANCFSRPSSLRPEHIDTAFPGGGERDFRTLKFELCRISGAVLDQAMDVRPTAYSAVEALYDRLCAFERHIPFVMRCRTALLSLPSVYADAESATRDSPAVGGELARTFQQFTLALNVSEAILFLQRPYFVRALQEAPQDPTRSAYAKSYLAVVERCNVLIEVVGGLYELYPTVTARHWFFWYHLFTAAVCLGTMIILNPTNPLAGLVLGQIDHSIKLYSSVLRDHATPSLVQNHQWLLRLRARALSKVEHAPPPPGDEADVDVELLGWRTRLVERARDGRRATTIRREGADNSPASASLGASPSASAVQPPPLVPPAPTIDQVLQQHFVDPTPQRTQDAATDFLLHQFWDPTTLLESREGAGGAWWNTWGLNLPDLQNPM